MDDLFIIFVIGATIAGWFAGWTWNRYDVASQCAALEREMNRKHELALKTADAATTAAETRAKVAENKLQAIEEARAAKEFQRAIDVCATFPEGTNARYLADQLREEAA